MAKHGIRRLPIVDARGTIIGIVTADDLTVLFGRELGDLAEVLARAADADESR